MKEAQTASQNQLNKKKKGKIEREHNDSNDEIEGYLEEKAHKNIQYEHSKKDGESKSIKNERKELSKKALSKELDTVIESSDIILEVLDARDPLSSRSKELESKILSHADKKKIILVLSKIDLIPYENAVKWKVYLGNEFPTILFKSNKQKQADHLSANNIDESWSQEKLEGVLNSKLTIGEEELINLLKNFSRVDGSQKKKIVNVGIVGFPNVGKSSIINTLKGCRAAQVSNNKGSTKQIQMIALDKELNLIDSPGVVFEKQAVGDLILKNVIKVEDISDPVSVLESIMSKVGKNKFLEHYEIMDFDSCKQFLLYVSSKTGKLLKGGIPDYDNMAKIVLKDFYDGKIKYFTEPPTEETSMDIN